MSSTPAKPSEKLYADHAATSFPKAPGMLEALVQFTTETGASPGRGAYASAKLAGEQLTRCRERLTRLIGADTDKTENVIFTLNTSDALNIAIKGIVSWQQTQETPKLHLITTDLDHNSVLRPFNELAARDSRVRVTRIACDPQTGFVDPADIAAAICDDTCLIACVHGSNVSGTIQPIEAIGAIAHAHGIPFLVDGAQTLGHHVIDVERAHIDLLAGPGHKGLLGPLGTGFLWIRPGLESQMLTSREGGTGSKSDADTQPTFMPDRFEPGSHNALGIIGLEASLAWLEQQGIASLEAQQHALSERFLNSLLENCPGLTLYGPPTAEHRTATFSIRIEGYTPTELSQLLEEQYGILTRSGIHCAPGAHNTFGTAEDGGTTRLSFGPFITLEEVDRAKAALANICSQVPSVV